ncbi:MAG: peptidyl-prolyl cis-trans isomerase [Gemmataceae bacterium]|nr:peptidyl-prolyl cis-trans isomerase [Gemmataceae bacterium]MDW8264589.1 peptidyl-prolyl cis-trans isomerase [Gemmataceae bacterium]
MRWPRLLGVVGVTIAVGCTARPALVSAAPPTAGRPTEPPAAAPPTPASPRPTVGSTLDSGIHQVRGPADAQTVVRIRAQVNGQPILDEEVRQAAYHYLAETLHLPEPRRSEVQKEILRRELERIIEREVILSDAFAKLEKIKPQYLEKLKEAAAKEFEKTVRSMKARAAQQGINIETDEDFKAVLRLQGLTLEGVRRQIERSFMAMEYMRSRIFPIIERIGHEQIRQYYEEHPGEFQVEDRVVWQHIFVDASRHPSRAAARSLAEQLAARAQKGEDFAALAAQYDDGLAKYNNGQGIGQRRGEIKPPEAEPILFQLADGQVGPIIELPSGFHVIRLVQRDVAGLRPLDEKTQAEIRKKLQGLIADREYKRIVNELKRKATIEISSADP